MSENGLICGYAGKILRVDLTHGEMTVEELDEGKLKQYIGGAALGVRYVFDEVCEGVQWSDPENRLFIGTGPLGGTKMRGSGSIAVVTQGALTNGMASSQANGFFGSFLRARGFDAVIVQGAAPRWSYLYIHAGGIELRDATHLVGVDSFDTDIQIKREIQKKGREASVLCVGQAGENLVKFACISVDRGHMAAHNGVGAVMGSKKLKAIVVERAPMTVPLKNKEELAKAAAVISEHIRGDKMNRLTLEEGTVGGVLLAKQAKFLPVNNYTTSIYNITPEKLQTYTCQYIRENFNAKPTPCWACNAKHCHELEIMEGDFAGMVIEEPEYECMAAFSSLVGITDVTTTLALTGLVDRYGMDVNEAGYVVSWVQECYEKGLLTKEDLDGLEMTWGNGKAIAELLKRIATRQGFGDILGEGVRIASERVGGEAAKLAVCTVKGNSPRGHDHRVIWFEMFDTCVSSLGTIESHQGSIPYDLLGMSPTYDTFDHLAVARRVAQAKGAMIFDDSLVTCRFQTFGRLNYLCDIVNAATGWDMNFEDAMMVGKRAVNLAKVFNIRQGIDGPKFDAPSMRYGSTPLDGVAAGKSIIQRWDEMLQAYYEEMGWDKQTGRPLAETLHSLSLDFAIPYVCGE